MDKEEIDNLVRLSHEAKRYAYCRYSQFRVGAALLCKDETIITGCNVENVSYGLTVCAERTALVKAVSEGHREFKAIAISSDVVDQYITPCGACRQFLVELYHGGQCTYPCFPGVSSTSTQYNILSKPLATFPHNHRRNNGQRLKTKSSETLEGFCHLDLTKQADVQSDLDLGPQEAVSYVTGNSARYRTKPILNYAKFGLDWDVYMTKPDMTYKHMKTGDLLPMYFTPDTLNEKKTN